MAFLLLLAVGPATGPAARSPEEILDDMRVAQHQLRAAVGNAADMGDPAKRTAMAPRAIPALRRLIADTQEMDANWSHPKPGQTDLSTDRLRAMLAAMGDAESVGLLAQWAVDPLPAVQARGRSSQLLASWLQSPGNATVQAGLVDQMAAVCRDHPDSDEAAATVDAMANSAATQALRRRLLKLLGPMKSPTAGAVRDQPTTLPIRHQQG